MAATVPLTKLDAVNLMLSDIGDRPVNTLTGSQRLDVTRSISTLEAVLRAFLTTGWWFNREEGQLIVDGSGHYNVPSDWASLEYVKGGPTQGARRAPAPLVVRQAKLYDRHNQNFVFTGEGPVTVTFTKLLPFEDLPNAAREYVYAAASVRNQSRALGSRHVDADLRDQARSSLATLKAEEVDNAVEDTTFAPRFLDLMHRR